MSTPSQKAKVLEELLQFLADPFFQIPVRTFMDERCLIFDPGMEAGEEHKELFHQYKKLVDALLESFCIDSGITLNDAIAGINKMNSVPDIRAIYQLVFEQVLAADDFDIFYQVMVKRNIMIQEQVLLMIIAATGTIPDSLLPEGHKAEEASANAPGPSKEDLEEEEILKEVMRKSKVEHDMMMAKKQEDEATFQKTVEISKQEVSFLKRERTLVEQDLGKMTIEDKPKASPPQPKQTQPSPSAPKSQAPVTSAPANLPPVTGTQKYLTSADAAMAWMQSAKDETEVNAGTVAARTAMADSLSKLSQSELQERQNFLKAQRDRLLAMKKEAREKELKQAEKSQSGRPQSARAARSAMKDQVEAEAKVSAAEQEKLEMRKAIAAKLRQEVIGNQH